MSPPLKGSFGRLTRQKFLIHTMRTLASLPFSYLMEMTQCFIRFLCFAHIGSTCTLYHLGLLHTWLLPRLSVRTRHRAGKRNLRLATCFVRMTSTVPYDRIRECLTHELYMKPLHKGAARRQYHLWRPTVRGYSRALHISGCYYVAQGNGPCANSLVGHPRGNIIHG